MKKLSQLQNQALGTFKQGLVTFTAWFFFLILIGAFVSPHVQSFNSFVKFFMGLVIGVVVWVIALRVGANYGHNAIYATGVFCDDWENYEKAFTDTLNDTEYGMLEALIGAPVPEGEELDNYLTHNNRTRFDVYG